MATIVKIDGKKVNIDTAKGAEAYLRSEGVDVEECVAQGMKYITRLKDRLKEKAEYTPIFRHGIPTKKSIREAKSIFFDDKDYWILLNTNYGKNGIGFLNWQREELNEGMVAFCNWMQEKGVNVNGYMAYSRNKLSVGLIKISKKED